MTKSQEMILERVKKAIPKNFFHSENYEIKEFEVTEYDHFISVYASIGLKGDEGTMAAVCCRDTFHIFIGKRGGITYPMWNKKKKDQYTKTLRYPESLYTVFYDQKYN